MLGNMGVGGPENRVGAGPQPQRVGGTEGRRREGKESLHKRQDICCQAGAGIPISCNLQMNGGDKGRSGLKQWGEGSESLDRASCLKGKHPGECRRRLSRYRIFTMGGRHRKRGRVAKKRCPATGRGDMAP